jgi:hypothetical protein
MSNNCGAEFSECRNYRYALWRIWDETKPLVMFIGLNPSTANETDNDPTIKSVCRIAKHNGYGGVYMMNCFPLVSTNPEALRDYDKEVFSQQQFFLNNQWLSDVSTRCFDVVFAWGNFKVVSDLKRDAELLKMFPNAKALQVNKNGSPKHPLYCKSETKLIPYKSNTGSQQE